MTYLVIIVITLIFSAFFSGMEIAFISSNRLKIEIERKQKTFASGIINIYSANPGKYIVTMLIGNNIALVIYGIVMAAILEPYIAVYVSSSTLILTTQTIISTLIILVTAEFLPKTIFRINPNASLNVFAVPVFIFYVIFYPLTLFVIFLSNTIFRGVFKVRIEDKINKKPVFSKVDIDDFINVNKSTEEVEEIEHDVKIFKNALDFSKIKLRECMVPRTEIEAVDINEDLENLKQRLIETGYSRIIVYKESIDNIVGYVHSAELFQNPKNIESMLFKSMIVPESMPANKLLKDLIKNKKSIAVVVDEFGGTSGIVTIEDIIEEITGEIEDEHDTSEIIINKLSDNEYLISGRAEVDFINEKYNLKLPDSDEYETFAGLLLYYHKDFPRLNEIIDIEFENFSIKSKILKVSKTRIDLIKIDVFDKNN